MHIVETNEQLDTGVFFKKGIPTGLTDDQWRAAIGQRAWGLFHHVMENYPCATCRDEGMVLLSGIHDVVNVWLGKGVYDREKWERFVKLVKGAVKKDHEAGHKAYAHVTEDRHRSEHVQEPRERAMHVMEAA